MENLKTFGKFLALAVLTIAVGAFVFLFAFWFFVAFLGMLAFLIVLWAIGIPISIKEHGVKTGYVRWFTFYPVKRPW